MKNLTIKISNTIYNTMKLLDKTAEKCLFVIDNSSRLIGTVTDGDLRRAILNGNSLNDKIKNCYNADPIYLKEEDSTSSLSNIIMKTNTNHIRFFKNGIDQGIAFTDISRQTLYFPTVSTSLLTLKISNNPIIYLLSIAPTNI